MVAELFDPQPEAMKVLRASPPFCDLSARFKEALRQRGQDEAGVFRRCFLAHPGIFSALH
jgi:hypothetical protein